MRDLVLAMASLDDIRAAGWTRGSVYHDAVDAQLTALGLEYCQALGLTTRPKVLTDAVAVLKCFPPLHIGVA